MCQYSEHPVVRHIFGLLGAHVLNGSTCPTPDLLKNPLKLYVRLIRCVSLCLQTQTFQSIASTNLLQDSRTRRCAAGVFAILKDVSYLAAVRQAAELAEVREAAEAAD